MPPPAILVARTSGQGDPYDTLRSQGIYCHQAQPVTLPQLKPHTPVPLWPRARIHFRQYVGSMDVGCQGLDIQLDQYWDGIVLVDLSRGANKPVL